VLERTMPGYRVGKLEEKLGIHCSSTSEILFEDLRVPKANLLHKEGEGFKVAMATLDGGRIGIAAQALGIAGRALDLAVAYAKQRQTFGRPIKDHQAIQWMIADMATRLDAARLLTYRAAALKDRPDARATKECSMAKLFASECANFCADKALQIHGGYGYSQEYEVERLYRDARITTLYEGTSEIQRLVVSKAVIEDGG
jgi:alkylation response protein AidB-like acyl-CoA dehydrogenase